MSNVKGNKLSFIAFFLNAMMVGGRAGERANEQADGCVAVLVVGVTEGKRKTSLIRMNRVISVYL